MYHFIEDSIRDGISMITTRYAQAKSHTLPGYDASRPHRHLIYLDANNVYGWSMTQPLPTGGFRFLRPDAVKALAPVGGGGSHPMMPKTDTYEVDLHYPQHLHDAHDDYPLAPETMEIGFDMYSPAQQTIFPQTAPQRKLTPNFRDKIRCVVHYCNLELYFQSSNTTFVFETFPAPVRGAA